MTLRNRSTPTDGSFRWSLPHEIARDEAEIIVYYTFSEAEPKSDSSDGANANEAEGVNREITDEEKRRLFVGFGDVLNDVAYRDAIAEAEAGDEEHEYSSRVDGEWGEEPKEEIPVKKQKELAAV